MTSSNWEPYGESSGFQPLGAPTEVPASYPRMKRRGSKPLIIVLAVIVAVTAGFAGSAFYLLTHGETPDQLAISTPLEPVSVPPASLGIGLWSGLGMVQRPDSAVVRGVWDGVAVFDFGFDRSSIAKAVDVATGETLWTQNMIPSGQSILSFDDMYFEDGKLAMSMSLSSSDSCGNPDEFVQVLGLRTGQVVSSRLFSVECAPGVALAAYHNGTVVVDHATSYAGYRDTDVSTPVWQVAFDQQTTMYDQVSQPTVLGGAWFLTTIGSYVSVDDGRVSSGSPGPWAPRQGPGQGPVLYDASGALLTMTPNGQGSYNPVTRWSDIDLTTQLWEVGAGGAWAVNDIACSSSAIIILDLVPVDSTSQPALSAIDARTGATLWTDNYEPLPMDSGPLMCDFIDNNHLLYVSGTSVQVVDPTTNVPISVTDSLFDATTAYASIEACGYLTCVTNFTPDQAGYTATVTAVDFLTEPVEAQWTTQFTMQNLGSFSYTDGSRVTYISDTTNGVYRILSA